MLIVFFLSVWMAGSAVALGHLLLRFFRLPFPDSPARIFAAFWTGFCAQLLLLLAALAFVPLSNPSGLLILLGPGVLIFFARLRPPLHWRLSGWTPFAGLFLLLICIAAARPQAVYDTGLYHYQLILWYREYGAVHGLALLHHRFGFTSSVFAAAAVLDQPQLASRLIHVPNVLVVWAGSLYAFRGFRSALAGKVSLSSLFWPISFSLIIATLSRYCFSSSPDVMLALLVMFFFWLLHEVLRDRRGQQGDDRSPRSDFLLILAGATAFSVKSSGILLLATGCLVSFWLSRRHPRALAMRALAALLAAVPTLYINAVTTGYPLYPVIPWALPVPWRLSFASFLAIRKSIANFPFFEWNVPYPMTPWEKLHHLFLTDNAQLLTLSALSLILLPYVLRKLGFSIYSVTLVGLLACGAYQIFMVPVYRFNAGFLVLVPAIAITLKNQEWLWWSYVLAALVWAFTPWQDWNRLDWIRTTILLSIVCGYHILPKARRDQAAMPLVVVFCLAQFMRLGAPGVINLSAFRADRSLLIMPHTLKKLRPEEYVWRMSGQVRYRMTVDPDDARCWATPLPCAPDPKQAHFNTIGGLRLYNNSDVSGGFVEDGQSPDR